MRTHTVVAARPALALVLAWAGIAIAPATAQTSPRSDDGHAVTGVARSVSTRSGAPLDRASDPIRLTARDIASIEAPVLTPYRSTPTDVAPDGFSLRVPGTGLELTNGSLSIRRNDARNARGVSFSVRLTY